MIDKATHRHILYQLIKAIFQLPEAKHLAFKWGTLAYFFHGLPRFSTDIDLDLLHDTNQSKTYENIAHIAQQFGEVKFKKHLLISYHNGFDHIKIDLSRKIRKNNSYTTVDFYGTQIQVQDLATMVANKLVASLERTAQRDLFDVWFFLSNNFPLNEVLITERTWYTMQQFRTSLFHHIKTLKPSYKFLDGLGELLDDTQKQFVKNNLRSELSNLIQFKKDFS